MFLCGCVSQSNTESERKQPLNSCHCAVIISVRSAHFSSLNHGKCGQQRAFIEVKSLFFSLVLCCKMKTEARAAQGNTTTGLFVFWADICCLIIRRSLQLHATSHYRQSCYFHRGLPDMVLTAASHQTNSTSRHAVLTGSFFFFFFVYVFQRSPSPAAEL